MALSATAIMHDRGSVPFVVGITDRQAQVLAAIAGLTCKQGSPPTLRELMRAMGMRSPNGVMFHVRVLQDAELLDGTHEKQSRGRLRLTERARRMFQSLEAGNGKVTLRLLAPVVTLTPEEAISLASRLTSMAAMAGEVPPCQP